MRIMRIMALYVFWREFYACYAHYAHYAYHGITRILGGAPGVSIDFCDSKGCGQGCGPPNPATVPKSASGIGHPFSW